MRKQFSGNVIACHECDHLHHFKAIPEGAKALCTYCGNFLYRHVARSVDIALALYITSFILFIITNTFPFLALELGGRQVDNILLSGGWAMYQMGMGELGLLIFLTSIIFPAIVMSGMIYLLIFMRLGIYPPMAGPLYRLIKAITPWSLIGVFMLGTLISIVKLQDLANVIFGPALVAFAVLIFTYTAARGRFDPDELWLLSPVKQPQFVVSDKNKRWLQCHTCSYISYKEFHRCPRCMSPVHHRKGNSIEKTWALVITATVLILPANIYPVMTVIRFGQGEPSTILSGVIKLIQANMWGLALIVFVASIVVPVMKLIILTFLLISVQRRSVWRPKDRTQLYRVTEVVGAWSMVDIYLVGMLSALVSLGSLSTIRPGVGAIYFAAVVVVTMFAAQSFDPRLIWDNVRSQKLK